MLEMFGGALIASIFIGIYEGISTGDFREGLRACGFMAGMFTLAFIAFILVMSTVIVVMEKGL